MPVVCVAEYNKMVELFVRDGETYSGRIDFDIEQSEEEWVGKLGFFSTDGEWLRDRRRFATQTLRELGMNRAEGEEMVLTEISSLIGKISADIDAGIEEHDLCSAVELATGNVINRMLFGYAYDASNEHEFRSAKRGIDVFYSGMSDPRMGLLMGKSWLLNLLPGFQKTMEKISRGTESFRTHMQMEIDRHLAEMDSTDSNKPPHDYVTAFLREKAKRDASGEQHTFLLDQLRGKCNEIWFSGADDVQNNFSWGMAHALSGPVGTLQPLYDELDSVSGGNDRLVTMADRQSLPKVCSFVMETLRIANTVPQNIAHRVTRDVVVDGYKLPKDTVIIPQLSAVLYDPEVGVVAENE